VGTHALGRSSKRRGSRIESAQEDFKSFLGASRSHPGSTLSPDGLYESGFRETQPCVGSSDATFAGMTSRRAVPSVLSVRL